MQSAATTAAACMFGRSGTSFACRWDNLVQRPIDHMLWNALSVCWALSTLSGILFLRAVPSSPFRRSAALGMLLLAALALQAYVACIIGQPYE